MSKQPPKCPKCGFVMCEQFDEVAPDWASPDGSAVMVPNGTFKCYHCEVDDSGHE